MHEQILAALRTKFTGVSDSILGRIANRLAQTATTEEQVATAVEGVTLQNLLESYGDSRATEAQQTAVRNYEARYGLKDGEKAVRKDERRQTKEEKGTEAEQRDDDRTPSWAQALLDTNKALADRINRLETQRVSESRTKRLREVTGRLPESLRKPSERLSVEALSDDDFSSLIADVGKEVDGIIGSLPPKGARFGIPQSGGKQSQGELTEAQRKAIAHRDSRPSSAEGQPF